MYQVTEATMRRTYMRRTFALGYVIVTTRRAIELIPSRGFTPSREMLLRFSSLQLF